MIDMLKAKIKIILTDNMLARWNHMRSRANVEPLTKKDAEILMGMWSELETNIYLDRIGKD